MTELEAEVICVTFCGDDNAPTNISSYTLDVGGSAYNRTINLKQTDIETLAEVENKQDRSPTDGIIYGLKDGAIQQISGTITIATQVSEVSGATQSNATITIPQSE
jgi:hypothetical protein